ncbi:MAG: 7TM-DISM domain-containing protein, partial [Spirochaetaceae bacterium]|nr:7TM-DISM domain-containing protein [Spirochaetaceae bacterium]
MTRITGSLWIIFTLIVIALLTGCRRIPVPVAEKGIIDLRTWDFSVDGSVMLNGEWGFHWEEHLIPETIQRHTGFIKVPGKWNGYIEDGRKLPGSGYSTYILTLLMPENHGPLALRIKSIKTAYTLYADGEPIASAGRPGIDAVSSIPWYEPLVADFSNTDDRIELLVHVSNYHHRDGGIWDSIELGTESEIHKIHDYSHTNEIFVISCIVIMGLYHITLYTLRRRNPATLYFGILCLIIAIRTLTVGNKYAFTVFPWLPWEILLKTDYLSFFTAVPVFLLYLRSMFPRDFSGKAVKITIINGAVFSLFVFLTPSRIYTRSVQVYQVITLAACLYAVVVLTQAIRKKREGSVILAIGFLPLFVLVLNDILFANQIIITGYYLHWGMLIFLGFQAFIIARRYTVTLYKTEKQAIELGREIRERKRLHDELELSHEQFAESRLCTIMGLVKLAEFRDKDTGTHLERIREYSRLLAAALADLAEYS